MILELGEDSGFALGEPLGEPIAWASDVAPEPAPMKRSAPPMRTLMLLGMLVSALAGAGAVRVAD